MQDIFVFHEFSQHVYYYQAAVLMFLILVIDKTQAYILEPSLLESSSYNYHQLIDLNYTKIEVRQFCSITPNKMRISCNNIKCNVCIVLYNAAFT